MKPTDKPVLKKALCLFYILLSYLSCLCQENRLITDSYADIKIDWLNSVFIKHNIDLTKFNYKNIINMGMNDTTMFTLSIEIGNSDSLSNTIIPYKSGMFISRNEQSYWIITSEFASHDFNNNTLLLRNGLISSYYFNSQDSSPIDSVSYKEMRIDIKLNKIEASSD